MGTIPGKAEVFDAIVIGAGIAGVIFLKYASERGLQCLALEKQDEIGGLWTWLPAWQDIQNRKEDFAINDVPLAGVKQADVLQFVRAWVQTYDLAPLIRLQHEVISVSWKDQRWSVQTDRGTFAANYLIVATGVQNEPWIPQVERSDADINERHSSNLHQPGILANQRVTVVGGGTSAWDLLDLAIEHQASEIHWVHRSNRWCLPTSKTKQSAWPNLRELSIVQTLARSTGAVNRFLRWLLRRLYDHFQVTEMKPAEPFDIQKHQLIPGRATMIQNLQALTRHQSEVESIRHQEITLKNGERFASDILLWGTGYRMNLAFLDLPEYRQIDKLDELRTRLGSLVRALDYPHLFFLGMSLADSTSSTPFLDAVEAKSIVAHILGQCEIPRKMIPNHVAYWDLFKFFASFDQQNYPRPWWRVKYFLLVWWYWAFHNKRVQI